MKITNYDDLYPIALSTGSVWVGGSDGSNSGYTGGDVVGGPGELSVVGLSASVSLGSNLLPVTLGDVLTIIQESPAVAIFATSSNSAVGSNAVTRTLGGQETIVTVAASGSTEALDVAGGNVFDVTLTADCTLSFTNVPVGVTCAVTVLLRQDGTGGWEVTWPGSVEWPGGVTPTLSTDPNAVDVFALFTLDGGTTWFGFPTGGSGTGAVYGTPAIVLGTAAAAGSIDEAIRRDSTIVAFDATVPTTAAFGASAATGSAAVAARRDHVHGMPAEPATGVGEILISDMPSTPLVFADLVQNEAQDDLLYADP